MHSAIPATGRHHLLALFLAALASMLGAILLPFRRVLGRLAQRAPPIFQAGVPLDPFPLHLYEPYGGEEPRVLGTGGFGSVFLLRRREDCADKSLPLFVAMKEIPQKNVISKYRNREIMLLQEVRHKNIVRFYGTKEKKDEFLHTVTSTQLFMEACHGDLGRITKTNRILSQEELKYISQNILEPLKYLHTAEVLKEAQKKVIIHRDLKPANIFVMVPGATFDDDIDWSKVDIMTLEVFVGDFGIGRHMPAKEAGRGSFPTQTKGVGTEGFKAPEVLSGKYDQSADIYSFGAIIYKLATGTPLEENFDPRQLWNDPRLDDPALVSFLLGCLQHEPGDRPTAEELLAHPFLTGGDALSRLGAESSFRSASFMDRDLALGTNEGLVVVDVRFLKEKWRGQEENGKEWMWWTAWWEDTIATGDLKGQICLWDVRSLGEPLKRVDCHNGPVLHVDMNDKYLVSSGEDDRIVVHSRGSWKKIGEFEEEQQGRSHQPTSPKYAGRTMLSYKSDPDQLKKAGELGDFGSWVHLSEDDLLFATSSGKKIKHYRLNTEGGDPELVREIELPYVTWHVSPCLRDPRNPSLPVSGEDRFRFVWVGTWAPGWVMQVDMVEKAILREVHLGDGLAVRKMTEINGVLLCNMYTNPACGRYALVAIELRDMEEVQQTKLGDECGGGGQPSTPPLRLLVTEEDLSCWHYCPGNNHVFVGNEPKYGRMRHFTMGEVRSKEKMSGSDWLKAAEEIAKKKNERKKNKAYLAERNLAN